MYLIKEMRGEDGICFEKYRIENEKAELIDNISIRAAQVDFKNQTYYLIYDSQLAPISECFVFLNFELADSSANHVLIAVTALKLLYSFCEIFKKDIRHFTKLDANNLMHFLKGISRGGNEISLELSTIRSNSTIGLYLSIYRRYVKFIGIAHSPLLPRKLKSEMIILPETETAININPYEIRAKRKYSSFTVPMYTSVNDFKVIIEVIRNEYTLRDEIIVRLMYENGLRIGEVLGLTLEDIKVVESQHQEYYYLYIRNRLSDTRDRHAKGCMKIISRKQYSSSDYKKENFGYQKVVIHKYLYEKLVDYINDAHTLDIGKFQQNYNSFSKADAVTGEIESNAYIFLNSIGKPLTANLWNKTLRDIFRKSGLFVDDGNKKHNLSHRFRHGFAMFMIRYKNIQPYDLKILLRHTSIQSVFQYYRPTEEDVLQLKNDFVSSIYQVLPELSI